MRTRYVQNGESAQVSWPYRATQSGALRVLERTGSAASDIIVQDKHGMQPGTNFFDSAASEERRVTTSSVTPAVPPPEQGCECEPTSSFSRLPRIVKTSTATANVSPRTALQRAPAALYNQCLQRASRASRRVAVVLMMDMGRGFFYIGEGAGDRS
ncbi:hypothetical protein DFH09DRAFT_1229018 [Mycena vulgaris]|nr:hypothetical protein DFH09DRAFT_1229018 [Mycena vulgaris]